MREDLLNILTAAARKLHRTRAAESAAVLAAAGGFCAAALQAAWILAPLNRLVAVIVALAAAAAGLCIAWTPALSVALRLGRRQRRAVAALLLAGGAAGAAFAGAGWYELVPRAAVPVGLIGLGALLGAAAEAASSLTKTAAVVEAARYLDERLALPQRLATAAELACSEQSDSAAARCVYAQTLTAIRGRPVAKLPMWRRTPATAGALCLAVAICLTLAFVPSAGAPLDNLSAQRRAEIANRLREAAKDAQIESAVAEQLIRAAVAVEVKDEKQLQQAIAELRKLGFEPLDVMPERLLAALAEAHGAGGGAAPTNGHTATTGGADSNGGATSPGGGEARVFDPMYANYVTAADGANDTAGAEDGFVPRDRAWAAARRRAADALSSGRIPPEYRRLVRDFFLARQ